MAAAVTKLAKPTKGVRPNLAGVPGELIKATELPAGIEFFTRKKHDSPYDARLKDLLDAGVGSVLLFGDPRARASLTVRSRKLGMKLEFGEHMGKLYVRLAASSTAPVDAEALQGKNPSVKEVAISDHKTRNRSAVIAAIRSGARTPEAMAAFMRKEGNTSLDGPIVRSLLKQMQKDGAVNLLHITPETWELTGAFA